MEPTRKARGKTNPGNQSLNAGNDRVGRRLLFAPFTLALWLAGCGHGPVQPPRNGIFTDVTAASGITFEHFNGMTGECSYPEIMGGGVCAIDFNKDGWLDLYFVNGTVITGRRPDPPPRGALYRNNRDGTFTDVTLEAGLGAEGYGQGCCSADYDGDGDMDLYVTRWGRNVLYDNNGDGTFSDATDRTGTGDDRWGQSCAFADADSDGDLDLFVENYLDWQPSKNLRCVAKTPAGERRDYCSPDRYKGQAGVFFENDGRGAFVDRTRERGLLMEQKGMGLLWFDAEGDGDLDLYVSNDGTPNFLFINDGSGGFEEQALERGVAYDGDGKSEGSMGVDGGDFDNDGDIDLIVPCLVDETFTLYENAGDGNFTDVSLSSGLSRATYGFTGFSPAFLDFDNDGDLDLFFTTGGVYEVADVPPDENAAFEQRYGYTDILLANDGNGTFVDVSSKAGSYFARKTAARGAAAVDFDNDGDTDLVVVLLNSRAVLLRNDCPDRGHWIGVELEENPPNRHAYGAVVRCIQAGRTQMRLVKDGGGYLSKNDWRALFGLGGDLRVERIEVRWPSGKTSVVAAPGIDRYLRVRESDVKDPP